VAHTSIEAWLGEAPPATMTVTDLVRRYLAAFGPASVMDAQQWCGLTRLGEVFEAIRPELITFRDPAGRELFDLPEAPRPDPDTPAPPRFLYDYDNLLLSHKDRTRVASPELVTWLGPPTNVPWSFFTVDGMVSGRWKSRLEGRAATLDISPMIALADDDAVALATEGEALLRFLAPKALEHTIHFT
jgi:hypothetical protein